MTVKRWLLAALMLLPGSSPVWAELVESLFQQSELVLDQSSRERERALDAALRHTLVRVSGNARVLDQLRVTSLLQNPAALVDAYRYESTDATLERDGEELPASRLVVSFSRSGVEKLLRDAGLPLWSANRPSVLIWLVKDDLNSGRQLVSLQDDSEVAAQMRAAARLRGLPIVVPMLDLEDRLSLSPNRLWQLDQEAIIEASRRYRADAVVVGRYSQTSSGSWLGAWSVWHKDKREVFDLEAPQEDELLQRGIGLLADYLADLYALVYDPRRVNQAQLEIMGVEDYADYIAVLDYLQQLDVVRQVQLQTVHGASLLVALTLAGDVDALLSALELDRRLQAPQRPAGVVSLPTQMPLRFHWRD